MTAVHTPGPWDAEFNGTIRFTPDDSRPLVSEVIAVVLANNDIGSFKFERQAANARLIASAPDLLAALRNLSAAFHKGDDDCTPSQLAAKKAARAAIARATYTPEA